jgi:hypothetical protein
MYSECDICENEDVDVLLYAKEGQIVAICKKCRDNISKYFGIDFEEVNE